jgi:O-antigen ligase
VNRPALLRGQRSFLLALVVLELLVVAVAVRSPLAAVVMVAALGVFAVLAPLIGTRKGTFRLGVALLVTILVLPGDLALQYRVPVGGGGIFIIDMLLGLLVLSWVVQILVERRIVLVRSPVTLPLVLFLLWMVVAALIGRLAGNDLKTILQDMRGLGYFVLFVWVLSTFASRDLLCLLLRVLAACLVAAFLIGIYYAALGKGQQIGFVEAGVSRFPAPNEVFIMGAPLLATLVVMWPSGRRRPWFLWALLVLSLVGMLLALVRGYWIGLAAGMAFLLLVSRTQQRVRLIGGGLLVLSVVLGSVALLSPALFDSVVTRALAVGAYGNDTSVQYRLIENRAVMRQIEARPALGNGFGASYLFDFSRYGVAPFQKVYIHNNYLWFAQRMGLVGLGLFVWMMVAFLVSCRGLRRYLAGGDPYLVGLVVGSRVMIVGLLVVSISSPQFNVKGQVAVIAAIMGMAEVAGWLLRQDAEAETSEARLGAESPPGAAMPPSVSARSSESG